MSRYTALTIGPITDTMMLTSSPAGLWGASYLFSWIARSMIQELVNNGVKQEWFVSPFFTLAEGKVTLPSDQINCEDMRKRGVGLFHDRIIFCSDQIENALGCVNNARTAVIEMLARSFSAPDQLNRDKGTIRDWLDNYLRIYAVEGETSSPLLDLGKHLSAMELEPWFPGTGSENYLLSLLEDTENPDDRNGRVKSFLTEDRTAKNWILYGADGQSIQDLESIAANSAANSKMKHTKYYAVLNSDGDSMGAILKRCKNDVEIRDFSRKCLLFCGKAAEMIQHYGGVPIYAGGDDTLALLPVVGYKPNSGEEYSIFGFVESLRKLFNEEFRADQARLDGKPTISFGISIQYYKSPLYEALEQARNLLFQNAKGGLKNACCLNLRKHSGQSALLCEEWMDHGNAESKNLFAALDALLLKTKAGQEKDEEAVKFLSSAGAAIDLYEPLFYEAIRESEKTEAILDYLYTNLFDNADQQQFRAYLNGLKELTSQLIQKARDNAAEWKKRGNEQLAAQAIDEKHIVNQLKSIIRMLHFMREKGSEEE